MRRCWSLIPAWPCSRCWPGRISRPVWRAVRRCACMRCSIRLCRAGIPWKSVRTWSWAGRTSFSTSWWAATSRRRKACCRRSPWRCLFWRDWTACGRCPSPTGITWAWMRLRRWCSARWWAPATSWWTAITWCCWVRSGTWDCIRWKPKSFWPGKSRPAIMTPPLRMPRALTGKPVFQERLGRCGFAGSGDCLPACRR
jgi:tyrosyl-tRNA synthetase (EC 6.1.1.1)